MPSSVRSRKGDGGRTSRRWAEDLDDHRLTDQHANNTLSHRTRSPGRHQRLARSVGRAADLGASRPTPRRQFDDGHAVQCADLRQCCSGIISPSVSPTEGAGDGNLALFLRWEQLAAYARGTVNNDWDFLGIRRAKRTVNEGDRARLSVESSVPDSQQSKDIRALGLVNTVAARASGLIESQPSRLTVASRDLLERAYLPLFTEAGFRKRRRTGSEACETQKRSWTWQAATAACCRRWEKCSLRS